MFDDDNKVVTHAVAITLLFVWFAVVWFFPFQAGLVSAFVGGYTIGRMFFSFGKYLADRFL